MENFVQIRYIATSGKEIKGTIFRYPSEKDIMRYIVSIFKLGLFVNLLVMIFCFSLLVFGEHAAVALNENQADNLAEIVFYTLVIFFLALLFWVAHQITRFIGKFYQALSKLVKKILPDRTKPSVLVKRWVYSFFKWIDGLSKRPHA